MAADWMTPGGSPTVKAPAPPPPAPPPPPSLNYAPSPPAPAPAPAGGIVGGTMQPGASAPTPPLAPAVAPKVSQGVIGAAMAPPPQVAGTNTAGNVAKVDGSQFGNMTPNASATAQQATAATTGSSGYDASQADANHWAVTDDQTVAGQVAKITAADGLLSQQAATRATQDAAKRGLINSSMAVQAGQAAVLNAALPIAQQDATTYGNAAKSNTEYDNEASQFNTTAKNTASQFGAAAQNTAALQDSGNATDVSKTNAALGTDVSKTNAGAANALQSQQIDNQAKTALQNAAAQNDATKTDATSGLQAALANQDAAVKQSAQTYDASVKAAMQDADAGAKLQLQEIDANTRTALADIEAKYKNQMQSSQSMSNTYQSMIDGVSKIMMDKDLDAAGKQAAIENLTTLYNGALSVQETIVGLDLGNLLSSSNAPAPAPVPAEAPAPKPVIPSAPDVIPG